jgi:hypothetical protein
MKIIGYTVGTTLPKPNLKQTDPTKGDYVKGKEILDEKYIKVEEQELTEDQKAQVRANVNAVSVEEVGELINDVAYISTEDNENVENPDVETLDIVIDSALSETSTNPVQNKIVTAKINEVYEQLVELKNSSINVYSGNASAMTSDVGSDGDVYLVID